MRKLPTTNSGPTTAFTLIELLVVIGIIGVLAAMIFPAANIIKANSAKKKARAELEMVALAIDRYKEKLGHYPPDNPNPNNTALNPLFYELVGTVPTNSGGSAFVTLDGDGLVKQSDLLTTLGVSGVINARRDNGEGSSGGNRFLEHLRSANVARALDTPVVILTTSIAWPANRPPVLTGFPPGANPLHYDSSSPTNNSKSYDLWVDIPIGSRLWRISNWGEPHVVN